MTIFVGDDWAEDHHDIHLMDPDGAKLASRRLPEGLAGIRGFHELVAAHAEDYYDEVSDYVRRQPAVALGIAAGIGFLVGLILARR